MKVLAIIHYIINSVIQDDYSQYQCILFIAIVWKEYENGQIKAKITISFAKYADLDKFTL